MCKIRRNSQSGYLGVHLDQRDMTWYVAFSFKRERYYLGSFLTPEEGADAYDQFMLKYDPSAAKNNINPLILIDIKLKRDKKEREIGEQQLMDAKKLRDYRGIGGEAKIQNDMIEFMTLRGWLCRILHCNMYQVGLPDTFCAHRKLGQRWIEFKCLERHWSFTPAQLQSFPELQKHGVGIWILTGATEEEYSKLFQPPNWWQFLAKTKGV